MSKAQKYLAFDIETAAEFPTSAPDWRRYRPLGIACAATLASDEADARVWHGHAEDGHRPHACKGPRRLALSITWPA